MARPRPLRNRPIDPKQLQIAYAAAFGTPEGQMVLDDLMRMYDVASYVKGDTHETAYREGSRSVLRRILALVDGPNEESGG